MHRLLSICLVSLISGLTTPIIAATKYVSSPPLTSAIKTPVGNVKSGAYTQVPIITWGADIRTIFANGNARSTQSGSIFSSLGLKINLVREDSFPKQLKNYISGKSPYLRGTLGMINMAAEIASRDPRTKPVIIYQLSESSGGDALVVKKGIRSARGLRGKTIALQAYGPHVDYLTKILQDAGLSYKDVKLKWLPDLTGTNNSPMNALYNKDIDAAMVIIPDALALTSGGKVGSGSEQSVKGAKILLSTKTANRIIADVYAVRSDYFKSRRSEVERFVKGLMLAQQQVKQLVKNKRSKATAYSALIKTSAKMLLDSSKAVSDTEGLYADADHTSFAGNKKFFTSKFYPRNFKRRVKQTQRAFIGLGLLSKNVSLSSASWDYRSLKPGSLSGSTVEAKRFDRGKLARVITRKQRQGTLKEGELFSFEVYFKPNQKTFPQNLYEVSFSKVIDLASTYGGAVITIEGHSDPLGYLRKQKANLPEVVLRRTKQSAKNLSLMRANAVRDSIINIAKSKQITLDPSQFTVIGHGIESPKSGMCGGLPCAPKNKQQWLNNMRVVFRIIQVEAESSVFKPL